MTDEELDEHINWFKSLLEVHDRGDAYSREVVRAAIVAAIKLYERQKHKTHLPHSDNDNALHSG